MYITIHQGSLSSEINNFVRTQHYNIIVFDSGLKNIRRHATDILLCVVGCSIKYRIFCIFTVVYSCFLFIYNTHIGYNATILYEFGNNLKNWFFDDSILSQKSSNLKYFQLVQNFLQLIRMYICGRKSI